MTFQRRLLYLIVISSCVRLVIAGITELGNDEVYYYTYALHLQWNYFDHPPGVALLIRFSTLNLWLTSELFVRLGAICCAAAGTWLSYKTGLQIRNERTGWYAALLYTTSIYSSIIAGTFILPDSPQIVCWLAALFILTRIISRLENKITIPIFYWLLYGLFSGLCVFCKVHGIFLWVGFGLYILIYNRQILLQPWLYLSFLLSLIIFSPIIFWNINNEFVTWHFHSSRIGERSLNISSFVQAFFGQIFYNNPVNVAIIFIALYHYERKRFLTSSLNRIFFTTGLPIIIIVTLLALFNPVLPHWSGPGFVTLSFPAAAYLDKIITAGNTRLPAVLKSSLALILVAVVGGTFLIQFYPGTLGSVNEKDYGSGDFTLDLSGWKNFELQYSAWLHQQKNSSEYGHLKIVCNKWFPASHIEYYIAEPINTIVVGVGSLEDLHNFAWLNQERTDLQKGENALCFVPSNYSTDVTESYKNSFSSIEKLHIFTEKRNGKTSRFFTLYLLKNYTPNDEVHTMRLN